MTLGDAVWLLGLLCFISGSFIFMSWARQIRIPADCDRTAAVRGGVVTIDDARAARGFVFGDKGPELVASSWPPISAAEIDRIMEAYACQSGRAKTTTWRRAHVPCLRVTYFRQPQLGSFWPSPNRESHAS